MSSVLIFWHQMTWTIFDSELGLCITCKKSFRMSAVSSRVDYWLILSPRSIVKEDELGSLLILPPWYLKHCAPFSLKRGRGFYLIQNAIHYLFSLCPCLNTNNYGCFVLWHVQLPLGSVIGDVFNALWKDDLCCLVLGYRAWLRSVARGWWSYQYPETGTHPAAHMDCPGGQYRYKLCI